jgi:DNA-binding winged helix-turn-helix (wHTH) protein
MASMDAMATDAGSPNLFQVGSWVVDAHASEISDGDRVVRLRPKALAFLMFLARHPNRLVTRQQILDVVWPDVVVGDASVTVVASELREALGDSPDQPTFIETIPRRGYRLIAKVSGLHEATDPPTGEPSRFWLMGRGLRFALVQGENVVGRTADAHVRIPSNRVSRRHARIVVDGDSVTVEDLGSKNGVFVGEAQVTEPTLLAHGDELRLGQMAATLRVVAADNESTITELSHESPPTHPVKGPRSKV